LSPDITGTFNPLGVFGGKNSYKHESLAWYLWWGISANHWVISQILGDESPPLWYSQAQVIADDYDPLDPATGVATIAEIV